MAGIIFRTCGILSLSPSRSCVCTALIGRLSGPPFPAFRRIRAARHNILLLVTKEYIYISRYLSVRTCNQFGEIAAHPFRLVFFLKKNGYRITGQKSSDLTLLVFCTLQPCLLYPPPPPPVYFNKVFRSLKVRHFKETIPVGKLNTSSGNLLL